MSTINKIIHVSIALKKKPTYLPIFIFRFFIPYYPYVDPDILKDTSAILTVLVLGIAACNLQIWSTLTMFSAFLDAKGKKVKEIDVDI
jgi:hypothetical protein